ncbi:MAG: division/cell wall cluster transcriptional repressor MraZ [Bacteroidetes bacterium]|jgi:MraZ protein|nr:division/cell wall cluster transcriptional repressor MraZ [Bacteroidota bacterium]
MLKIIGKDYCTVDSNGRFKFPSSLKKQLISVIDNGFVIRESIYGNYLELYPMDVWEDEIEKIRKKLNPYNPKDIILIRKLSEGNKVELDNNDRLLIPGDQKKAKSINKDIILVSRINIFEIWDVEKYNEVNNSTMDYVAYANERIGQFENE